MFLIIQIIIRFKKENTQVFMADLSKSKNLLLSKIKMGDFKRLITWVFGVEPKTQDLAAKARKSLSDYVGGFCTGGSWFWNWGFKK